MADAPEPGIGDHQEQMAAAKEVITLKIRGEEFHLAPNNIPINEKLILRKATGLSFESFGEPFGEDSIVVIYWLARRGRGETFLTWPQAVEDWESMDLDLATDFEMLTDDGRPDDDGDEGDLPESSGPV